jgi:hypothetical protein
LTTTNSELLSKIIELKTDIDDQTNLCSNIFKLDVIKESDVYGLIESTSLKIEELKSLQNVISNRNYLEHVVFQDKDYSVQELIKFKEGIILKKTLKTALIGSTPTQSNIIKISLEAFQSIQEYKKILIEIQTILTEFNNTPFELKDFNK